MRSWLVRAVVFVVLLLSAEYAQAQNALVAGTIKDQSGAVMPGVTLDARNQETGLSRTAVSDDSGHFRLPALPPGTYTVMAEIAGFTKEEVKNIVLVIDQSATLDFTLRPAQMSETVAVVAEAPMVDTAASTVSTSVSNQQIQDLPVASRRWIDLAMLTPGTSQDNIRGAFYRGNVNIGGGAREYSNAFVVDGVNNTWAEMGEPRQNFAMDSIREFKVSTSNYKAEYGLATGGLLTVVSKSGTNQMHGSGLLFFRDKSLTAPTIFETKKPDYRRYQYGGTVGGPIIQNKTHYFVAFERTDEKQFLTVNSKGIWPQYDGTYLSDQNRWTYSVRADHQLSATQTLFFRGAQENEYRPIITAGGSTAPSAAYDFAVPRDSALVGHTWILNQHSVNDFRFQYAFAKYEVAPPYSHGDWEAGDFGQDRLSYCTPVFRYPSITVGGCGNSQMGPEGRWEIKDDYSYLMTRLGGVHQWKTGFDISYIPFKGDNMGSPLGSWTFPKDTVYNPADPSTYPTQYTNSLPTYADIPTTHLSFYLQDDWQPAHNLTLNLGLRYDLQRGSFNENLDDLEGRIADKLGPGFGFPLPIPFLDGSNKRGDRNNFGPRVGLAWDPRGNGRTNVHVGYGMFYDNMRTLQNFGELTWPQSKTIVISNPSYPDPLLGKSRDQFISTAPPNITVYANDTVNPYAHQVNAGVTHMLFGDVALTGDVTFTNRYSDRNTIDLNLPDPVTKVKPYPQFGRVSSGQPTADNDYRALLLKVEKRMSHHYQYLVSYTLSKATDTNFSNVYISPYGFTEDTIYAVADRRHRVVASGIVQLPYEAQVSAILDLRSSLPFGPTSSLDLNADGYTGDLPAGVVRLSGCRGLDLGAVNTFRTGRGLTPVSDVTCAGFSNLDLRFSKFFTLGGSHRVEVIAQLFNVFDHANLGTPSNNLGAGNDPTTGRPLFGTATTLLPNINAPSRQVELAVRYQF